MDPPSPVMKAFQPTPWADSGGTPWTSLEDARRPEPPG